MGLILLYLTHFFLSSQSCHVTSPQINENELQLQVMDEDTAKDDDLGTARVSLAKVRTLGKETVKVSERSTVRIGA